MFASAYIAMGVWSETRFCPSWTAKQQVWVGERIGNSVHVNGLGIIWYGCGYFPDCWF